MTDPFFRSGVAGIDRVTFDAGLRAHMQRVFAYMGGGLAITGLLAWVVAHRRNHAPWLITMRAEFFFNLIREFDPAVLSPRREDAEFSTPGNTSPQPSPQSGEGEKISEAHVAPLEIQHNNTETPKTKEQQT